MKLNFAICKQNLPEAQLIKVLLLSAVSLISTLPRVDGKCYSSFESVQKVVTQIQCNESVDPDLYHAFSNFLQAFP